LDLWAFVPEYRYLRCATGVSSQRDYTNIALCSPIGALILYHIVSVAMHMYPD